MGMGMEGKWDYFSGKGIIMGMGLQSDIFQGW